MGGCTSGSLDKIDFAFVYHACVSEEDKYHGQTRCPHEHETALAAIKLPHELHFPCLFPLPPLHLCALDMPSTSSSLVRTKSVRVHTRIT